MRALNGAGRRSPFKPAPKFTVDRTPPKCVDVMPGRPVQDIDPTGRIPNTEDWVATSYMPFLKAKFGCYDPESGIVDYMIGVGTCAGCTDIVPLTDIYSLPGSSVSNPGVRDAGSNPNEVNIVEWETPSFTPVHGTAYFVSVQTSDGAGWNAADRSDGVVFDVTPPSYLARKIITSDIPGSKRRYSHARSSLSGWWDWAFVDPESGIESYQACVGSQPGTCDVQRRQFVGKRQNITFNGLRLRHAVTYYVSVRGTNNAGDWRMGGGEEGVTIDFTPAVPIEIRDGNPTQQHYEVMIGLMPGQAIPPELGPRDIDYQSGNTSVFMSWEFLDYESGVESYEVAVTNAVDGTYVLPWTFAGNVSQFAAQTTVPLVHKGVYRTWVRATNGAGHISDQAGSDGFIVDQTPPAVRSAGDMSQVADQDVTDGTDDRYSGYVEMYDEESGMVALSVAVGTYPGGTDVTEYAAVVLPARARMPSSTAYSAAVEVLDVQWVNNLRYYLNIRATNGAGITGVTHTDGIVADLRPPRRGVVLDGHGEVDARFQRSTSSVAVQWRHFWDLESNITTYFVGLGHSLTSGTNIAKYRAVPGTLNRTTIVASIPNGRKVYAYVYAVDQAGHASQPIISNGVVVDATDPLPGAVFDGLVPSVAGDLDYQFTNDTIRAAWTRFRDLQSGIADIRVAVGTAGLTDNVVAWTHLPPATTAVVLPGLALNDGATYTVSVLAINGAGGSTQVSSDGVTIDASPPTCTFRRVPIPSGASTATFNDTLPLEWECDDPESGVALGEWSVDTIPGGRAVKDWANIATTWDLSSPLHRDRFSVVSMQAYYVTLRVTNGAGQVGVAVSPPVMLDNTPPEVVAVGVGSWGSIKEFWDPTLAVVSSASGVDTVNLPVVWRVADYESGLASVEVGVSSSSAVDPGTGLPVPDLSGAYSTVFTSNADIVPSPDAGVVSIDVPSGAGADGVTVFVTVVAVNVGGQVTTYTAPATVLDTTPPVCASVIDGVDPAGVDVDVTPFPVLGAGSWSCSDAHSPIVMSQAAVVGLPTAGDAVAHVTADPSVLTDVGATSWIISGVPMQGGMHYYTVVRLTNAAGVTSGFFDSDGTVLDITPPVILSVGAGRYQTPGSGNVQVTIVAEDAESGLVECTAQRTSAPGSGTIGAVETATLTAVTTQQSIPLTFSGLTLSHGDSFFVDATCTNAAGAVTRTTSAAITVDNTPPLDGTMRVSPKFPDSFSTTPAWTSTRTIEGLQFSVAISHFRDPESLPASQFMSLGSTAGADDLLAEFQLPVSGAAISSSRTVLTAPVDIVNGTEVFVNVRTTNIVGLSAVASQTVQVSAATITPGLVVEVCDGLGITSPVVSQINASSSVVDTCAVQRSKYGVWLTWSPFSESTGATLMYEMAIGTSPGATDVLDFEAVGEDPIGSSFRLHNLTLDSGVTYYGVVRASNPSGARVIVSSDGFRVDSEPPTGNFVLVGEAGVITAAASAGGAMSSSAVNTIGAGAACAAWSFDEPATSITGYTLALGTRPQAQDVLPAVHVPAGSTFFDPTTVSAADLQAVDAGVTLADLNTALAKLQAPGAHLAGETLHATVTATDESSLTGTAFSANGAVVDLTPPVPGSVYDFTVVSASPLTSSDLAAEISRRNSNGQVADDRFASDVGAYVAAHWTGFTDLESGVYAYEWCIGSSPGAADLMACTPVAGPGTHAVEAAPAALAARLSAAGGASSNDTQLFVTVVGFNGAGQDARAYSNGLSIDVQAPQVAPVAGVAGQLAFVPPGTGAGARVVAPNDTAMYSSVSHTVSVAWPRFTDSGAGLSHFEVCLSSGTATPAACDAVPRLIVASSENAYTWTGLALTDGRFTAAVWAVDRAGGRTMLQTMQPLSIDTTVPAFTGSVLDTDPVEHARTVVAGTAASLTDVDASPFDARVSATFPASTDVGGYIAAYDMEVCRTIDGSCVGPRQRVLSLSEGAAPPADGVFAVDVSLPTSSAMESGVKYFVRITAVDAAGNEATASSDGFVVDATPPVLGFVADGPACDGSSAGDAFLSRLELCDKNFAPAATYTTSTVTSTVPGTCTEVNGVQVNALSASPVTLADLTCTDAGTFVNAVSNGAPIVCSCTHNSGSAFDPADVVGAVVQTPASVQEERAPSGTPGFSAHFTLFEEQESSRVDYEWCVSTSSNMISPALNSGTAGGISPALRGGAPTSGSCNVLPWTSVDVTATGTQVSAPPAVITAGVADGVGVDLRLLTAGTEVFTYVKACNSMNMCSVARSNGVLIDGSAPGNGIVSDGLVSGDDQDAVGVRNTFSAAWFGLADAQSEVTLAWDIVAVPQSSFPLTTSAVDLVPGVDGAVQVMGSTPLPPGTFSATAHTGPVEDGWVVFPRITATNEAGMSTTIASDGVMVDTSAPTCADSAGRCVVDVDPAIVVQNVTAQSVVADIDISASTTTIAAAWVPLEDAHSGLRKVEFAVCDSTRSVCPMPWAPIAATTLAFRSTSVALQHGTTYFVHMRATNRAGGVSEFMSDGIVIDASAPVVPTGAAARVPIRNGAPIPGGTTTALGTADLGVHADWNDIRVSWSPCQDGESAISAYEVGLSSTSAFSMDLLPFTAVGNTLEATLTADPIAVAALTPAPAAGSLADLPRVFVSVRCWNHAGGSAVFTSGPAIVDSSVPPAINARLASSLEAAAAAEATAHDLNSYVALATNTDVELDGPSDGEEIISCAVAGTNVTVMGYDCSAGTNCTFVEAGATSPFTGSNIVCDNGVACPSVSLGVGAGCSPPSPARRRALQAAGGASGVPPQKVAKLLYVAEPSATVPIAFDRPGAFFAPRVCCYNVFVGRLPKLDDVARPPELQCVKSPGSKTLRYHGTPDGSSWAVRDTTYVSVEVVGCNGKSRVVDAGVVVVDDSPPNADGAAVIDSLVISKVPWIRRRKHLKDDMDVLHPQDVISARWSGFFDTESDIAHFDVALESTNTNKRVIDWRRAEKTTTTAGVTSLEAFAPVSSLEVGESYRLLVRAENYAGLSTVVASDGFSVEPDDLATGEVRESIGYIPACDGEETDPTPGKLGWLRRLRSRLPRDQDHAASLGNSITVSWRNALDKRVSYTSIEACISGTNNFTGRATTASGAEDDCNILDWSPVGAKGGVACFPPWTLDVAPLACPSNATSCRAWFYVALRAVTEGGQEVLVRSDGLHLDRTDPEPVKLDLTSASVPHAPAAMPDEPGAVPASARALASIAGLDASALDGRHHQAVGGSGSSDFLRRRMKAAAVAKAHPAWHAATPAKVAQAHSPVHARALASSRALTIDEAALLSTPWLQTSLDSISFTAEFRDTDAGIERVVWSLGESVGDQAIVANQVLGAADLDAGRLTTASGQARVLDGRQGSFMKRSAGEIVGVTKAVARVRHSGLSLQPGREYWLTVQAFDNSGRSTTLNTRLVPDATAPVPGKVVEALNARAVRRAAAEGQLAEDLDYLALTDRPRLTVQWAGFHDPEATTQDEWEGVQFYEWAIVGFGDDAASSGVEAKVQREPIPADFGNSSASSSSSSSATSFGSTTGLGGNTTADAELASIRAEVLGTLSAKEDEVASKHGVMHLVTPLTNVGRVLTASTSALNLVHGKRYAVLVRACNAHGLCSSTLSDGFIGDAGPAPCLYGLRDRSLSSHSGVLELPAVGSGASRAEDLTFTALNTEFGAQWSVGVSALEGDGCMKQWSDSQNRSESGIGGRDVSLSADEVDAAHVELSMADAQLAYENMPRRLAPVSHFSWALQQTSEPYREDDDSEADSGAGNSTTTSTSTGIPSFNFTLDANSTATPTGYDAYTETSTEELTGTANERFYYESVFEGDATAGTVVDFVGPDERLVFADVQADQVSAGASRRLVQSLSGTTYAPADSPCCDKFQSMTPTRFRPDAVVPCPACAAGRVAASDRGILVPGADATLRSASVVGTDAATASGAAATSFSVLRSAYLHAGKTSLSLDKRAPAVGLGAAGQAAIIVQGGSTPSVHAFYEVTPGAEDGVAFLGSASLPSGVDAAAFGSSGAVVWTTPASPASAADPGVLVHAAGVDGAVVGMVTVASASGTASSSTLPAPGGSGVRVAASGQLLAAHAPGACSGTTCQVHVASTSSGRPTAWAATDVGIEVGSLAGSSAYLSSQVAVAGTVLGAAVANGAGEEGAATFGAAAISPSGVATPICSVSLPVGVIAVLNAAAREVPSEPSVSLFSVLVADHGLTADFPTNHSAVLLTVNSATHECSVVGRVTAPVPQRHMAAHLRAAGLHSSASPAALVAALEDAVGMVWTASTLVTHVSAAPGQVGWFNRRGAMSTTAFCNPGAVRAKAEAALRGLPWFCDTCPAGLTSAGGAAASCTSCHDVVCLPRGENTFEAAARVALDEDLAYLSKNGTMTGTNFMARRLNPGVRYSVTVKATTASGTSNTGTTDGFMVDLTAPRFVRGSLLDGIVVLRNRTSGDDDFLSSSSGEGAAEANEPASGPLPDSELEQANQRRITSKSSGDQDVDYTTVTDQLSVTWTGMFDKLSGVAKIEVCFGTAPGVCDTVNRTTVAEFDVRKRLDLSPNEHYTATGLALQPSTRYYATVFVTNGAGLTAVGATDGVMVDATPPKIVGVFDGLSGLDLTSQSQMDLLFGNWEVEDPEMQQAPARLPSDFTMSDNDEFLEALRQANRFEPTDGDFVFEYCVASDSAWDENDYVLNADEVLEMKPGVEPVCDMAPITQVSAGFTGLDNLNLQVNGKYRWIVRAINAAGLTSGWYSSNGVVVGKAEHVVTPTTTGRFGFDTSPTGGFKDPSQVPDATPPGVVDPTLSNVARTVGSLFIPKGAMPSNETDGTIIRAGTVSRDAQQNPPATGDDAGVADPSNQPPGDNFMFNGYSFTIRALGPDGKHIDGFRFEKPVVISLAYNADELVSNAKADGRMEDGQTPEDLAPQLNFFSKAESRWMDARDTCPPEQRWSMVDTVNKQYHIRICHLTQWAVFYQQRPVAVVEGGNAIVVHLRRGQTGADGIGLDASNSYDRDTGVSSVSWSYSAGSALATGVPLTASTGTTAALDVVQLPWAGMLNASRTVDAFRRGDKAGLLAGMEPVHLRSRVGGLGSMAGTFGYVGGVPAQVAGALSPERAALSVNSLAPGEHTFGVQVQDLNAAADSNDVRIIVNSLPTAVIAAYFPSMNETEAGAVIGYGGTERTINGTAGASGIEPLASAQARRMAAVSMADREAAAAARRAAAREAASSWSAWFSQALGLETAEGGEAPGIDASTGLRMAPQGPLTLNLPLEGLDGTHDVLVLDAGWSFDNDFASDERIVTPDALGTAGIVSVSWALVAAPVSNVSRVVTVQDGDRLVMDTSTLQWAGTYTWEATATDQYGATDVASVSVNVPLTRGEGASSSSVAQGLTPQGQLGLIAAGVVLMLIVLAFVIVRRRKALAAHARSMTGVRPVGRKMTLPSARRNPARASVIARRPSAAMASKLAVARELGAMGPSFRRLNTGAPEDNLPVTGTELGAGAAVAASPGGRRQSATGTGLASQEAGGAAPAASRKRASSGFWAIFGFTGKAPKTPRSSMVMHDNKIGRARGRSVARPADPAVTRDQARPAEATPARDRRQSKFVEANPMASRGQIAFEAEAERRRRGSSVARRTSIGFVGANPMREGRRGAGALRRPLGAPPRSPPSPPSPPSSGPRSSMARVAAAGHADMDDQGLIRSPMRRQFAPSGVNPMLTPLGRTGQGRRLQRIGKAKGDARLQRISDVRGAGK